MRRPLIQPRAKLRAAGLVLGALLATGCSRDDVHARAARLDMTARTGAYTWIVEHEPSALDVAGFPVDAVRPFDPGARIRAVAHEPLAACRKARGDRALLLFYAPVARPALRSAVLDCGFALERDRSAVIVAPR